MFNDSQMPHPLTVQLCGKQGNHSDEAYVKVVLNHDRGLKVCKCTNRSFSCPLQSHLQSEFMCEIRDGGHIFPMGFTVISFLGLFVPRTKSYFSA